MRKISLIVVALLSGCAPYGRMFANQCQGMGYEPGTALFLECFNEKQRLQSEVASRMQFMPQPFPSYQPYMMQTRTRRTTRCMNYGGGFVSCTTD